MISRVYVDNYRTLVGFELALGQEHLLLGRNGTGKTTVFDAIDAVVRFARGQGSIDDLFPVESLTRWGTQRQQTFALELVVGEGLLASYKLVIEHDLTKDRRRVVEESVQCGTQVLFCSNLGTAQLYRDDGVEGPKVLADWSRSSLPAIHELPENEILTRIKRCLARIRYVRPDPRRMTGVSNSEESELDHGLSNLVSWYRHLVQEDSEHAANLWEVLPSVLYGFVRLELKKEGTKSRQMVTIWQGDVQYSFDELSDGQRVLLGLAMLAAEPA